MKQRGQESSCRAFPLALTLCALLQGTEGRKDSDPFRPNVGLRTTSLTNRWTQKRVGTAQEQINAGKVERHIRHSNTAGAKQGKREGKYVSQTSSPTGTRRTCDSNSVSVDAGGSRKIFFNAMEATTDGRIQNSEKEDHDHLQAQDSCRCG